jgi:DNA-damage-inducible protein J
MKIFTHCIAFYPRLWHNIEKRAKGVFSMSQTTLSVRMDSDVKQELDALCADVGMTTSVAINMFAKAFIRERRLPFEVVASDSFYSESNQRHLQRSLQQVKQGQVVVKTMEELEDMADGED